MRLTVFQKMPRYQVKEITTLWPRKKNINSFSTNRERHFLLLHYITFPRFLITTCLVKFFLITAKNGKIFISLTEIHFKKWTKKKKIIIRDKLSDKISSWRTLEIHHYAFPFFSLCKSDPCYPLKNPIFILNVI